MVFSKQITIFVLLLFGAIAALGQDCASDCNVNYGIPLELMRGAKTTCQISAAQDILLGCGTYELYSPMWIFCTNFHDSYLNLCYYSFDAAYANCGSLYDYGIQSLEEDLRLCMECCNRPGCYGGGMRRRILGALKMLNRDSYGVPIGLFDPPWTTELVRSNYFAQMMTSKLYEETVCSFSN